MALLHSTPDIVREGLTYLFDIGNPKCYVGTGTTVNAITNSVSGISTVSGAVYNTSDPKSFVFDGTDDYITIDKSYNELGLVTGGDYTIIAWVYIDSDFGEEKRNIVTNFSGATQHFSWVLDNSGTPGSGNKNYSISVVYNSTSGGDGGFGGWTDTDISIPLDQWSMVSVRMGGIYAYFSINDNVYGGAGGSNAGEGTMNNSGNDMYIGKNRTGAFAADYFKGKISSVMFYNRKLSDNELRENYNSLKGRYGL